MISRRLDRALTAARNIGPYVLIEVLLPGGTLIALLLWLSQRFMREGFSGVRQHLFAQTVSMDLIKAKPEPGRKGPCLCRRHTAVFGSWPMAFRQICKKLTARQTCCAAHTDTSACWSGA